MAGPLKLTRDQLATFLKDHEQIRQFENLFATVNTIEPIVGTDFEFQADSAAANANSAQAEIEALRRLVQLDALAPPTQNNNSVVTDYIDLPLNGPHVTKARRIQWNEDDGTVDIGLLSGSVLQVGQELMYRVENNTGSTITNGTVCGAVGVSPAGYVRVAPYQATTIANVKFLLGVATVDIPTGELGYVTSFGFVRDIDTSAFAPGTVLYASGTTPGVLTATPPTPPIPRLIVALCAIQNATTGRILVRPDFGSSIEALHDVSITSPANGQVLIYDAGQGRWENANLTAGANITITNGAGSITIAAVPSGATGSFTSADAKTVTVVNGIITSIV